MPDKILGVDCETHSNTDLRLLGAEAYTLDPLTRCLIWGYKPLGVDVPVAQWIEGDPLPDDFLWYVANGYLFSGWNVIGFDRLVYERISVAKHGFPPIDPDRWVDSMHRAAAANLPRGLDGCAKAVGLGFQEDLKDKNIVRRATNAEKTPLPRTLRSILTDPGDTPKRIMDDMHWLVARNAQDVVLEEGIAMRLPAWPAMEPWLAMPAIDRRINDRGILVDVGLVRGMMRAAAIETARLDGEIAKLTDGNVPKVTNVEGLKRWLVENHVALPPNVPDEEDDEDEIEEETAAASRRSPWKLRKNDIADLLARDDVPDKCRDALAMRAEAGKVSISKLRTMQLMVSPDWRLRQAMTLGGAQQTMRFASQRVNLYNTVRDVFANPDEVEELTGLSPKTNKAANHGVAEQMLSLAINAGRTGEPDLLRALYERPRKDAQGRVRIAGLLTWVSRMARRTLGVPVGSVMMNGDFAQIEARITVWLAQQLDMLNAFATGQDVYKIAAAGIFRVAIELITKEMRQTGKVSGLALGFGGGPNALVAMGYNYGLVMSFTEAVPIVKAWREANPAVVAYWYATDDAAANAVLYPGNEFPVAPLGLASYFMEGDCLCCRLPTGRMLRYWQPRLTQEYWDPKEKTQPKARLSLSGLTVKGRAVFRRSLYHTVLVENQVQAIGADILGTTLVNADRNNVPVTLHVYDSMGAEIDENKADAMLPLFEYCMTDQPSWVKGLPIAADVDYGARFG